MERIYGIERGNNQYGYEKNSHPKTQEQLAADMNMDVRTLQNYKMMAEMIPELEDLMDTGIVTKTTALAKQRKVIVEYVRLCGYENGEMGNGRKKEAHNGLPTKLTLDEIATQLGTSKTNLKRALSIERNLTDSMKELLDTGIISFLFSVLPLRKENVSIMRRRQEKIRAHAQT